MKKYTPIFAAIIMVFGGLGAAAINVDSTENAYAKTVIKTIEIDFSKPMIPKKRREKNILYSSNPGSF